MAAKARESLDNPAPDHTEFVRYYESVNGGELRNK
jgi:hypothetical protein